MQPQPCGLLLHRTATRLRLGLRWLNGEGALPRQPGAGLGIGDIGLYNNGFFEYVAGDPYRWPVSYG